MGRGHGLATEVEDLARKGSFEFTMRGGSGVPARGTAADPGVWAEAVTRMNLQGDEDECPNVGPNVPRRQRYPVADSAGGLLQEAEPTAVGGSLEVLGGLEAGSKHPILAKLVPPAVHRAGGTPEPRGGGQIALAELILGCPAESIEPAGASWIVAGREPNGRTSFPLLLGGAWFSPSGWQLPGACRG